MLKKIKTLLAAVVLSGTVSANVQAATVTVQKGDTLWDLSRSNQTSVEEIQKLNNLTKDIIHPGDTLTIASKKRYKVRKGDNLWDLAKIYGVSVTQLKDWNNLITDFIYPGTTLVIYEGLHMSNKAKAKKPVKQVVRKAAAPKPAAKPVAKAPKKSAPAAKAKPRTKVITVKATAYTAYCKGCSGITKTGINIRKNPNKKVIAVDPKVIPLGTKVYVPGYGEAIAGDIGGAIKGNRIDVFIPSKKAATKYGVKNINIKILN
jgi:3D (Asp-Asp-Asp) domain-containing protein/LysM repeat protein